MTARIFGVVSTITLLMLAGCASIRPLEDRAPAPSSSYPRIVVKADAIRWALSVPGRAWSEVAPTGSMAPFMDSRSVVLLEPYAGSVHVGDWVVFDRGDLPNVLHRVVETTDTHVFISGVNVPRSDGWFPKTTIKWRVAGVLYSTR